MKTVTLYYFEWIGNRMGVWERSWHLTRKKAEEARLDQAKILGVNPEVKRDPGDDAEFGSRYGDLSEVLEKEVPLTPEGVVHFANDFAVGWEA